MLQLPPSCKQRPPFYLCLSVCHECSQHQEQECAQSEKRGWIQFGWSQECMYFSSGGGFAHPAYRAFVLHKNSSKSCEKVAWQKRIKGHQTPNFALSKCCYLSFLLKTARRAWSSSSFLLKLIRAWVGVPTLTGWETLGELLLLSATFLVCSRDGDSTDLTGCCDRNNTSGKTRNTVVVCE